jgi:hypothetical protein
MEMVSENNKIVRESEKESDQIHTNKGTKP